MRKWSPPSSSDDWLETFQVVVPSPMRSHVLSSAHDHPCSGRAGVHKTSQRALRYFYWPGMKSDVARYCRTCHTCQLVGKPNQVVPNAPATFQRLMNRVLGDVPNCAAYLDDLVVYSDTWKQHLELLELVFTCLSDASLVLNLDECEFGKGVVSCLGKRVGQAWLHR